MTVITQRELTDRSGEHLYQAHLLQEFGKPTSRLSRAKIRELWGEASQHPALFSDDRGNYEHFVAILFDPRAVWVEISQDESQVVGVAYVTDVILGYDAQAHFAFWDSIATERAPLINELMIWTMQRYNLNRLTVEVPPTQKGVVRFVKRLGFTKEGEKREATQRKGQWLPLEVYGILRSEVFDNGRK